MDTLLDTLVVAVRADTRGLQQSLGSARQDFDALATGAASATRRMEQAFEKFLRTGSFSFENLRQLALGVLADIASAALRSGLDAIFGGLGKSGGNGNILVGSLLSAFGLPGRATGGDVQQGRAYMVGERGPELFVPQGFGRIQPAQSAGRAVSITINMQSGQGQDGRSMARSANQVAAAVRRAIADSEGLA
jgi:Lambda phage tail tape-measure protein (Tape_meas_lam_C)